MTTPPVTRPLATDDDYDERDRWLDDHDHGWRWQRHGACRSQDPTLFFPTVVKTERQTVVRDGVPEEIVIETEEEPPIAPPEVRAICNRCPVAGRCLERNMEMDYGVYGGLTGYQRQLLTKKIVRKRCPRCTSDGLVKGGIGAKKEICLACGLSWNIVQ